jgi:cytochrome P450
VSTTHPADGTIRDNLLDPELVQDPYPYLAVLREQAPVHYSEFHRSWLVTRYHDVAHGLGDPRLSSDRVKPLLARLSDEDRAKAGGVFQLMVDWMVVSDQPAHTRLRKLATLAFHPSTVKAMQPRIVEIVDQSIDAFIESGETDIVAGFSFPLPATVISELIGAPSEDAYRFKEWSDDLALVAFGAGGDARGDRHARAEQSIIDMFGYFTGLLEQRRDQPGEDMISALLAGDEGGERLDDDEIRSMCALMLFAGHETTTTTITSGIKLLLEHPDQLARMRAEPDLVARTVEEVLRYEGAIKVLHRWVLEDYEVQGITIAAGSRVLLIPAAANRDPRRFKDPDFFDALRKPNPHLAFGKGIHACIGAMLARLEMRIALQRLFERLPDMKLAEQDEPQWMPSLASRGLSSLHVEPNVQN